MDNVTIVNLLTNSGLKVFGIDRNFVYFEDPSCIFPAFDKILEYAWIVVLVLTAIMLFGWAALYIKNGVKINTLFNNAKSLILIFATLSVVKPAVNAIYGDDLFAKQCETKRVSLKMVNELLEQRNKQFGKSDEYLLYEAFNITDSGPVSDFESYKSEDVSVQISSSGEYDFISVAHDKHSTTYVSSDGTKIKRSGGSLSWQNNNPGNIINSSFARKHGAINNDGKWAIFPDEETGLQAMMALLRTDNYNDLTLNSAIHKWSPGGDHSVPNNYVNFVSKNSGVSVNTVLKNVTDNDLYKIVRAMQTFEGWTIGTEQKM